MLSSVHVSLKWATYSFETKPVPNITSSIKYYQNNPLMITDKKLSTFSRPALSVSTEIFKIQMLMPQIPPLMIEGISFVHLYNEGQVLAETLGF